MQVCSQSLVSKKQLAFITSLLSLHSVPCSQAYLTWSRCLSDGRLYPHVFILRVFMLTSGRSHCLCLLPWLLKKWVFLKKTTPSLVSYLAQKTHRDWAVA